MNPADELHTLGKLASALGCQAWHLAKLIESNAIPFVKAGGRFSP